MGKAFGLAISRSRVQILLEAMLRNNLRQVIYTYVLLSPSSISLFFPCNTITLGGTSKPIAFLGSGNDSDDYLLQPHFVRKIFFLIFSCFI